MRYAGLLVIILVLAFCLPSCEKETKGLKEEIRVVKEENSFLKAENIALKKEVEELYKKLEEKEKARTAAPQVQPVPAKVDTPKKDVKPPVSGKPAEKPVEKPKKPNAEKPR